MDSATLWPTYHPFSLPEKLTYDEEDEEDKCRVVEGQGLGGRLNETCLWGPVHRLIGVDAVEDGA